jgi:hypothetical protein
MKFRKIKLWNIGHLLICKRKKSLSKSKSVKRVLRLIDENQYTHNGFYSMKIDNITGESSDKMDMVHFLYNDYLENEEKYPFNRSHVKAGLSSFYLFMNELFLNDLVYGAKGQKYFLKDWEINGITPKAREFIKFWNKDRISLLIATSTCATALATLGLLLFSIFR